MKNLTNIALGALACSCMIALPLTASQENTTINQLPIESANAQVELPSTDLCVLSQISVNIKYPEDITDEERNVSAKMYQILLESKIQESPEKYSELFLKIAREGVSVKSDKQGLSINFTTKTPEEFVNFPVLLSEMLLSNPTFSPEVCEEIVALSASKVQEIHNRCLQNFEISSNFEMTIPMPKIHNTYPTEEIVQPEVCEEEVRILPISKLSDAEFAELKEATKDIRIPDLEEKTIDGITYVILEGKIVTLRSIVSSWFGSAEFSATDIQEKRQAYYYSAFLGNGAKKYFTPYEVRTEFLGEVLRCSHPDLLKFSYDKSDEAFDYSAILSPKEIAELDTLVCTYSDQKASLFDQKITKTRELRTSLRNLLETRRSDLVNAQLSFENHEDVIGLRVQKETKIRSFIDIADEHKSNLKQIKQMFKNDEITHAEYNIQIDQENDSFKKIQEDTIVKFDTIITSLKVQVKQLEVELKEQKEQIELAYYTGAKEIKDAVGYTQHIKNFNNNLNALYLEKSENIKQFALQAYEANAQYSDRLFAPQIENSEVIEATLIEEGILF